MRTADIDERAGVIMAYKNPFNENMSHAEAREILFREIEKTTDRRRFERLEEDYADVIPVILRREIGEVWNKTRQSGREQ